MIDEDEVGVDEINIGCKVKIFDMELCEEVDYAIVGSTEADPSQGKISNESPVGAALLGHKVGDVVEVEVPEGKLEFKVINIYR